MGTFEVATKALILNRGKVLLLKRASGRKTAPGEWDTPGGKIRFGEAAEDALRREIDEETGIKDISINKVLNVWSFFKDSQRQLVGITFVCSCRQDGVRLSAEHSNFQWADPQACLESTEMGEGLKQTLRDYIRQAPSALSPAEGGP
jgi:8-oxo-dGTP diphosphatase